jgi:hypothetical protein
MLADSIPCGAVGPRLTLDGGGRGTESYCWASTRKLRALDIDVPLTDGI